jgi:hypothetical protein
LFLECPNVTAVVENVFKRITRDNNFDFSRKEFFTTFDRRTFSCAKNRVLTIVSKIVKKYNWDCKTRYCVPTDNHCWECIIEKVADYKINSGAFKKIWEVSGLFDNIEVN